MVIGTRDNEALSRSSLLLIQCVNELRLDEPVVLDATV
jgi:hypothetical protein